MACLAVLVALLGAGLVTNNADALENRYQDNIVECIRYQGDRCVGLCGPDIYLDITNILQYPVTVNASDQKYEFDPCSGIKCGNNLSLTAVCRTDLQLQKFDIGHADSFRWTLLQTHPLIFKIQYFNGNRQSQVTFYQRDNQPVTTMNCTKSDPLLLEYEFEVQGNFVNQTLGVPCSVNISRPCMLACGGKTIDLSSLFPKPIIAKTISNTTYTTYEYSACVSVECSVEPASICEVSIINKAQKNTFTLGTPSSAVWKMVQKDPLILHVAYSDGYGGRNSQVTIFDSKNKTDQTVFKFIKKDPELKHTFEVKGYISPPPPPAHSCTVDVSNPCIATCNGQKFDISNTLLYPVTVMDEKYYRSYMYSPCSEVPCGNITTSAVCQTSLSYVSINSGKLSSVTWTLLNTKPYKFLIVYGNGQDGRQSNVTFIEENDTIDTVFSFIPAGSSSLLTYAFEVRGKNLGQPGGVLPSPYCTVDNTNPCTATCSGYKFDASRVLNYPVTTTDNANNTYTYSPCSGTSFGPLNAVRMTTYNNVSYTAGTFIGATWAILNIHPFIYKVMYSDGQNGRQSQVTFIEDKNLPDSTFTFVREFPIKNYEFEVRGRYIGQPGVVPPPPPTCTVDDSNPCIATCGGNKFDITNTLSYPAIAKDGRSTYFFNCKGDFCGNHSNSAVCQKSRKGQYSRGSTQHVEWNLIQSVPYYQFIVEYSGGTDGSKSRISFEQNPQEHGTTFEFLNNTQQQYNFVVHGQNVGQPSVTKETCTINSSNPCVLICNGEKTLDISNVFQYPIMIKAKTYNSEEQFFFSPCTGSRCGCRNITNDNAMCQPQSSVTYSCGKVTNVTWIVQREFPYVFTVAYTEGDSCDYITGQRRKTIITFYEDKNYDPPEISFVYEAPLLNYNFEVRGWFVGQTDITSLCVVDRSLPCAAVCGNNIRLDLSKLFPQPTTISTPRSNFVFSPCADYSCGYPTPANTSVCQEGPDQRYNCGQRALAHWTLVKAEPYIVFTISYNGGDCTKSYCRHSVFTFVENPSASSTATMFAGANSGGLYLFDVIGSNVGQQTNSQAVDPRTNEKCEHY